MFNAEPCLVRRPALRYIYAPMNLIRTLAAYRDLVANLVARDLKSRYQGSALGFLWTVLNPLFMAAIYIFFLRLLGGRGIALEDIIIGVFAWQFTTQCVNGGLHAFTGNATLVKKVFFPRIILPTTVVLASLVNFLLTLLVQLPLVALFLWYKHTLLSGWTLALPVVILYQTLFNLELALVVSAANVYYRDTSHLAGLILSAWFFMSPVMYPLELVRSAAADMPWVGDLYLLNPMALIITAYRALQVPGAPLPMTAAAVAGWLWPLLAGVIVLRVFERKQRFFADVL
ncbi:MAG: ABC transporter permease [Kiritimatiellaeota bacterium]|nr:ABC transporter permease [Kiritimatiellota bacterium]